MPRKRPLAERLEEAEEKLDRLKLEAKIIELKSKIRKNRRK